MKKTHYYWIDLVFVFVFGSFVHSYIKEWMPFLFVVFLFLTHGVLCSLDEVEKIKRGNYVKN